MQSGITASTTLHSAFTSFFSDASLFALPITITGESLTPLPALPFSSSSETTPSSFTTSLPKLTPHLTPTTPRYLVLRRPHHPHHHNPSNNNASDNPEDGAELILITYVPSGASVRAKTLFASTRATVVRELGRERFASHVFVTEAEDVLDREWGEEERGKGNEEGGPLTNEERELQEVRRAEEEERHGTKGREVMGLGSGDGKVGEVQSKNFKMGMDDAARQALRGVGEGGGGGGVVVQLAIDLTTETLILSHSATNVDPADLSSTIPPSRPSFTFYHYPSSPSIIFIYCCPSSCKVRERMIYASSRRNVVHVAKDEGVEVAKRIEIGAPDEIDETRLKEEIAPSPLADGAAETRAGAGVGVVVGGAKPGFARPKRPGKRP